MKSILSVIACAAMVLFAVSAPAQAERPAQTFKSSAGPIKITPVYHASLVIEAGGKGIGVDPAKPAGFTSRPHARFLLTTDIHRRHLDPALIADGNKAGAEIHDPPGV